MNMDICIGAFLAKFGVNGNGRRISNFLSDMIYDGMKETTIYELGYDEGFDGTILYDSISDFMISVVRVKAEIYFKKRYTSKNFSKKFIEKYQ